MVLLKIRFLLINGALEEIGEQRCRPSTQVTVNFINTFSTFQLSCMRTEVHAIN
jgi:hypothetical protein